MKKFKFILLSIFFSTILFSQSNFNKDSLVGVINKMPDNTNKVKLVRKACVFLLNTGQISEAETYVLKFRKLGEQLKRPKTVALSYNYMGTIYDDQGKYPEAIASFLTSQKMYEDINYTLGISDVNANLGLIYFKQRVFEKAKNCYEKAIKYYIENNRRQSLDNPLHNLGSVYMEEGNYEKATALYQEAYDLRKEFGKLDGCVISLHGLGIVNEKLKHDAKAVEYYREGLKLAEELGDPKQMAYLETSLAGGLINCNKQIEALPHLLKSVELAQEQNMREVLNSSYYNLYLVYKVQKNSDKALLYFEKSQVIKDSLFNEENTRKSLQAEVNFEFEKKQAIEKVEQEKKDAIKEEEAQRQKVIRNSFIGGFVLMFALAFFIFRGYRQKQKANEIITKQKEEVELQKKMVEHQKELIEEKQTEILDSIHYARRIQRALITPEKYIDNTLKKLNKN